MRVHVPVGSELVSFPDLVDNISLEVAAFSLTYGGI